MQVQHVCTMWTHIRRAHVHRVCSKLPLKTCSWKEHMVMKRRRMRPTNSWREEQTSKHLHLASIRPACFIVITIHNRHAPGIKTHPMLSGPLWNTWPTDLHMEIHISQTLITAQPCREKTQACPSALSEKVIILVESTHMGGKPTLWKKSLCWLRDHKKYINNPRQLMKHIPSSHCKRPPKCFQKIDVFLEADFSVDCDSRRIS